MATIRFGCKNCGSPHVRERDNKLYCTSCGKVFEKNVESVEERDARILYLSRLDNAEKQLTVSPPRFDDAEDYYREFIKQYPSNSDGYWGLVRAKYGIKYEDDATGRKIPACYKSSYEDFRADKDFLNALRLAESDMLRSKYMTEAEKVAGVCKEWREEASKYDYDVFISFKATDDVTGKTTSDCEEMKELYTHLLEEGYKVFFSPKSMRRFTGKHYDAYIHNAIQKAKVMIVYGSKEEYFKSTWVENEWTRFLRLIDKNEKAKGSCIVAYDGDRVSPKDLPRTLRSIQAIDASKKNRSFYVDITKAIKRAFDDEEGIKVTDAQKAKEEDEVTRLRRQIEEMNERTLEAEKKAKEAEDARIKAEEEAKRKAEEEARRKAEEEARRKAEEEAKRKAEEEAKRKAEEESKRLAEEKAKKDCVIEDGVLKEYAGTDTNVFIPDSVTSIGDWAFAHCSSLVSITIPDSVTSIGYWAFAHCSSLVSITIPNSVTRIGGYAFYKCSSLTSITIPDSVTSIGDSAFAYCSSLTGITLDENNEYYKSINGNLYSKDGKTLIQYAIGKIDNVFVIPDSVTSIGDLAFSGCSSLINITIPDSVTSIGNSAFSDCSSLTSITIPDSVTSIDNYAFEDCSSLTNITVDENNKYYKSLDGNLYSKDGKTLIQYAIGKIDNEFVIPDGVTSIGNYAFRDCSSLTSITIPDGVTSIGNYAFRDCSSLTSITIPDSVTSIGWDAFAYCSSLTSITIPDSVTSIGSWAFGYCSSLTSITIPNSVTSIGDLAFSGCSSLINITIPDSVTSIGNYAFYKCSNLSIYVPKGTNIDKWGEEWNGGRPVYESGTNRVLRK